MRRIKGDGNVKGGLGVVDKVISRWRSRGLKSGCGKRKPFREQSTHDSDPLQPSAKFGGSGAGLQDFSYIRHLGHCAPWVKKR